MNWKEYCQRGFKMGRIILFSPLGGTDPISQTNCREGSMLHICRHYKPDLVYLYMSKEIIDNQEMDSRYTYCIDRLSESIGHQIEYKQIRRPNLVEVHEFDYFYSEFRNVISEIYDEMDPEDELLINVSSGTPQMKSGLMVLKTMGEFPCRLIQVRTPVRKMNNHIHDNLEIELLWESNEDNESGSENRCSEVTCPTLSIIKNEEIIKKLINAYDYEGALAVAKELPADYTKNYISALSLGASRLLLDFKNVDLFSNQSGIDCTPIKDGGKRKYLEYALQLEIKLRKGEYADFVRAITPLLVDMFVKVAKKEMNIDVYKYCNQKTGIYSWSRSKLESTEQGKEIKKVLDNSFNGGFKYGNLYSEHVARIVETKCTNIEVKDLIKDLRYVESKVRNLAAHDIISVTEGTINVLTGFTPKLIMEKIKKLFSYTDISVKNDYWSSYDIMNESIIALIDKN